MRPSAPSAWLTDVIAPKAGRAAVIIMNRNRMKVTRVGDGDRAGGDAEAADTEHDEERHLQRDAGDRHDERRDLARSGRPCSSGALGLASTIAASRARWRRRRAPCGSSRSRARRPPRASPTFSCWSRDAVADPPAESSVTITIDRRDHEHDEPEQHRVDERIATRAPTKMSAPPTASTRPCVSTA